MSGTAASVSGSMLRLALRLALRDWRGGRGALRGMGIVLLCLALGVAAIGTIGGLRDAIQQGVAEQRRAILGGDLAIEDNQPLPAELSRFLQDRGARTSAVLRMRTMAYGPGGRRMLVELSAVDRAYPLVGAATLDGGMGLQAALAAPASLPGLAADPLVADRIGLQPGGTVRIGDERLRVLPVLDKVPDSAGQTALAPSVVIARPALDAAGLIRPGTLLTTSLRVALPDGPAHETARARLGRAQALAQAVADAFPGEAWRVRDIDDAAPALTRAVGQVALFMTLIALAALLLGGMGVAAGVSSWLESRIGTIAVLRAVGAPPRLAALVVGLQVAALCAVGIVLGMAVGLVLPPLAVRALGGLLPVAPHEGLQWAPVLLASAFGVVVAALFALSPLYRAVSVPPSVLFRGPAGMAGPGRERRIATGTAQAGLASLLVLLAVLTAPNRRLAFGFCVVAGLVLLLFRLAAMAMTTAARFAAAAGGGSGRAAHGDPARAGGAGTAGSAGGAAAAGAGRRPDRAGDDRAGARRPARLLVRPTAQARAVVLLHRHTAGRDAALRGGGARRAVRRRSAVAAEPARAGGGGGRGTGGARRGHPRHALGAARRPGADDRASTAAGHAHGGGALVAGRL